MHRLLQVSFQPVLDEQRIDYNPSLQLRSSSPESASSPMISGKQGLVFVPRLSHTSLIELIFCGGRDKFDIFIWVPRFLKGFYEITYIFHCDIFTDSALWAGSVIESPCPSVCLSVCLCHRVQFFPRPFIGQKKKISTRTHFYFKRIL